MAKRSTENSKKIIVRAGKYAKMCGVLTERPMDDDEIYSVPEHIQLGFLRELNTNKLIELYNYQRPYFDDISLMKTALSSSIKKDNSEHIRIYVKWDAAKYYRVLDLLEHLDSVDKISIIGRDHLNEDDMGKVYDIFRKCSNIKNVRFRNFRPEYFDESIFQIVESITAIHFRYAKIAMPGKYENIKEFRSRISHGICWHCNSVCDITHDNFRKFFTRNNQLNFVQLDLNSKSTATCTCDFKRSRLVMIVQQIMRIDPREMSGFIIRYEDGTERDMQLIQKINS